MSFLKKEPAPGINVPKTVSFWKISDTQELYKQNYKKHRKRLIYGPTDINYKLNKDGFRCDNFVNWSDRSYRVLFVGCSHTEGIGLPLKEVWARKFLGLIKKNLKLDIPYWNLAVGGMGLDQIVRLLFHYGPILRPQIVVSLLPELSRREREVGEMWNVKDNLNYEDRFFISKEYIDYQTEKNMAMINLMMVQLNSVFLFSPADFDPVRLDKEDFTNIKEFNFYCDVKDWARDLHHWGPQTHTYLAENMYAGFEQIIKNRLGYVK